jgi:hypothetical protein
VLVHQIWLGDRREDALATSYSAEDLVVVQRDIGSIVQYTVEMGGDIELVPRRRRARQLPKNSAAPLTSEAGRLKPGPAARCCRGDIRSLSRVN